MAPNTESVGEKYYDLREKICRQIRVGPTELYNRLNDELTAIEDINELRMLRIEIDKAVLASYGWTDIDPGHGFYEVPYLPESDRIRFTIAGAARVEVLRRLSDLNRQRYEQEVEAGLHKTTKKLVSGRKRSRPDAGDLFDAESANTETVDD